MKPKYRAGRYLVFLTIAVLACAQASWCATQKSEESLGRQYAGEFEKNAKLATDPQVLDRVNRIGQAIAKIANEHEVPAGYGSSKIAKFKYQFRVVEDPDVNAMSLPGGIVYVNTGLLDLVQSDDELAGVLAHEIAHAAHHHMSQLLKKSSSVDRYVALVALAGILGNARGRDLNNLLMGAQMLSVGKMSGYTMQAERDADRTAVAYLVRSSYSPEGLLTFMKKLEDKHVSNPTAPLGIFQTHPAPFRRVAAVTKAMQDNGLTAELRRLRDVAYAKAEPVSERPDSYEVVICKRVLYQPASVPGGMSSKERAGEIASKVNSILDAHIAGRDIHCDVSENCLVAKNTRIISAAEEDSALAGKTSADLLRQAHEALEYAVWADWLADRCTAEEDAQGAEH